MGPTVVGHKVVFEDIGMMAGALSNIHVVIPLNISAVTQQLDDVERAIDHFELTIKHALNSTSAPPADRSYTSGEQLSQALDHHTLKGHLDVTAIHRRSLLHYRRKIRNLQDTFPVNEHSKITGPLHRAKRFIWNLLSGIYGTFMGFYSRKQYNELSSTMDQVVLKQNRLLEVTDVHTEALRQLSTILRDVSAAIFRAMANPAAVTHATLQHLMTLISDNITRLVNALQVAQTRRLAIDFLSPSQILNLFQRCAETAAEHQSVLIPEHPSDLFQLEVSYVYNGEDITLLLHVPMVPKAAQLRLMRYRPFPIPINDQAALFPLLDRDVLAISTVSNRYTVEVKFSDLMECHQVNSYYLCERHGVISTSSNSSCLAALYSQQHDAALKLCNMELVDLTESVLQLPRNEFLVYNPEKGFTAETTCLNEKHDTILAKGPNTLSVPPDCVVQLRDHMLFSDTSVTLSTDQISYDWEWDNQLLGQYEDPGFISELKSVAHNKYGSLSLIDVIQTAETRQNTRYLATLAIAGLAFTCIVLVIIFLLTGHSIFSLARLHTALALIFSKFPELKPRWVTLLPRLTQQPDTPSV